MKINSTFPQRIRFCIILITGIFLIISGCYDICYIIQPKIAHENSHFDVKIAVKFRQSELDWEYGLFGILGILLPDGWTVKDSIKYNVTNSKQHGVFIFEKEVVSFIETRLTIPDGYHWWGAKTSGQIGWTTDLDSAFCDPTIFTNHKTGNFQLRYVIGNTNLEDENPYKINAESKNIPVRIDPSASISQATWKNEEWEIFPNPSQGEVYIRQESEPDGIIMRIYDHEREPSEIRHPP